MMIGRIRRFMKGKRGQGMTEYIIIVALIAIAAIVMYAAFGRQIQSVVRGIGLSLTGQVGTPDDNMTAVTVQEKDMGEAGSDTDF